MTTAAALAYSTSSRQARVLDPIARVAAAGRVAAERRARQARADAEHARQLAEADALAALIRADFPGATFGVKVCDTDAKWRATDASAEWVAWLVVTVGDVEYWPMTFGEWSAE